MRDTVIGADVMHVVTRDWNPGILNLRIPGSRPFFVNPESRGLAAFRSRDFGITKIPKNCIFFEC